MSDPKRLLDEGADPLGLAILRSGEDDAPPESGRERTLLALGLSGAALTGTKVATTASVGLLTRVPLAAKCVLALALVGSGAVGVRQLLAPPVARVAVGVTSGPTAAASVSPGSPGPGPATGSVAGASPATVASAVAGASEEPASSARAGSPTGGTTETGGSLASAAARPSEAPRAPSAAVGVPGSGAAAAATTSGAAAITAVSPAPDSSGTSIRAPEPAAPAASTPASAPSAPSAPASAAPSLADEVRMLDQARTLLAAHDAAGALRALDAYQAAAPRGSLGAQALLLRVEALLARGDRAAATSLGRSFVASHPRSPVADRLRALVGDGSDR